MKMASMLCADSRGAWQPEYPRNTTNAKRLSPAANSLCYSHLDAIDSKKKMIPILSFALSSEANVTPFLTADMKGDLSFGEAQLNFAISINDLFQQMTSILRISSFALGFKSAL